MAEKRKFHLKNNNVKHRMVLSQTWRVDPQICVLMEFHCMYYVIIWYITGSIYDAMISYHMYGQSTLQWSNLVLSGLPGQSVHNTIIKHNVR